MTASVLDERSRHLRRLVVNAMQGCRRGHLGPAFSLIEILRVLYDEVMRFRPDEPNWPQRDRFVLSKGHGCLAQYALLADKGFISEDELLGFCRHGSPLAGHPEWGKVPGIEASTGSLGHGLSIGVGFALNARLKQGPQRVFVVIGDGESNEGAIWEAALAAGKHRLANLTVFIDYNHFQSYGPTTEVQDLEPLADKWRAFGFAVDEVDGHDIGALREVCSRLPLMHDRPTAVICHTVKGKGISFAEHNPQWHHQARIGDDVFARMLEELA